MSMSPHTTCFYEIVACIESVKLGSNILQILYLSLHETARVVEVLFMKARLPLQGLVNYVGAIYGKILKGLNGGLSVMQIFGRMSGIWLLFFDLVWIHTIFNVWVAWVVWNFPASYTKIKDCRIRYSIKFSVDSQANTLNIRLKLGNMQFQKFFLIITCRNSLAFIFSKTK